VYLPPGGWYDFWTNERLEGGREYVRPIDLATIPLYVRAGTILPLGPIKQHTGEKLERPLSISIHSGADASFLLYEDDGRSFNYRKGEWMGIELHWTDARRVLTLRLAPNSRILPPIRRRFEAKFEQAVLNVHFDGEPIEVAF